MRNPKNSLILFFSYAALFMFAVAAPASAQWITPAVLPPDGNPPRPIDLGPIGQIKRGSFAASTNSASGVRLGGDGTILMKQDTASAKWSLASGILSLSVNGGGGVIDLTNLVGIVLPKGLTAATPAVEGSVAYNSSTNMLQYYDGSKWNALSVGRGIWLAQANGDIMHPAEGGHSVAVGISNWGWNWESRNLYVYGDVIAKDFKEGFAGIGTPAPLVTPGILCGIKLASSEISCNGGVPHNGCPAGWTKSIGFGKTNGWNNDMVTCVKS